MCSSSFYNNFRSFQIYSCQTSKLGEGLSICLGQPATLPQRCLPTEAEVYNATVHKRQEFNLNSNTYNKSKTDIYNEVAEEIITLWVVKGNLPTLPEQTVVRKVTKVCDNAKAILKI